MKFLGHFALQGAVPNPGRQPSLSAAPPLPAASPLPAAPPLNMSPADTGWRSAPVTASGVSASAEDQPNISDSRKRRMEINRNSARRTRQRKAEELEQLRCEKHRIRSFTFPGLTLQKSLLHHDWPNLSIVNLWPETPPVSQHGSGVVSSQLFCNTKSASETLNEAPYMTRREETAAVEYLAVAD